MQNIKQKIKNQAQKFTCIQVQVFFLQSYRPMLIPKLLKLHNKLHWVIHKHIELTLHTQNQQTMHFLIQDIGLKK